MRHTAPMRFEVSFWAGKDHQAQFSDERDAAMFFEMAKTRSDVRDLIMWRLNPEDRDARPIGVINGAMVD